MSEAEALETGEQPEGQDVEQQEQNPEFNGYIDFEGPIWKDAPKEVKEQARLRLAQESREKAELKRKLEARDKRIKEQEDRDFEARKPKQVQLPDPDLAITDPDKFLAQQQEYLKAHTEQADWDRQRQEREQRQIAEAQRVEQERLQKFVNNAEKVGMTFSQINAAAAVINGRLPPEVGNYLVNHQFGPQILAELAGNPVEVELLASLNPIEAGVKLEAMAQAYKASTKSNAPPPDEPIRGSAAIKAGLGPPGATYK